MRQLVRETHQQLDVKGLRGWQLAQQVIMTTLNNKGLVDDCDIGGWCEETPWFEGMSLVGWLCKQLWWLHNHQQAPWFEF